MYLLLVFSDGSYSLSFLPHATLVLKGYTYNLVCVFALVHRNYGTLVVPGSEILSGSHCHCNPKKLLFVPHYGKKEQRCDVMKCLMLRYAIS